VADRVLHAQPPTATTFSLRFHCWSRQSRALFSPLRFKVLLVVDNIPVHLLLSKVMLAIIGSSCLSFELALDYVNRVDLSRFFVVAWARHPDLIPNGVGCLVPEPEEQLAGVPPLFTLVEEIIHSKQDTLQFWVFVHVLKVHDFIVLEEYDDERLPCLDSSDDGDDVYRGYDVGRGLLTPWLRIFRLADEGDESGRLLPSLPHHGGGARWSSAMSSPVALHLQGGGSRGLVSMAGQKQVQMRSLP
jgi:hypothetical protein